MGPDGAITITTEGVDLIERNIKSVRTTIV
jgi:hypothetical protein